MCVCVCGEGGVHTCDASNAVPLLTLVLTYARADGESECSDERRLFLCEVLDLAFANTSGLLRACIATAGTTLSSVVLGPANTSGLEKAGSRDVLLGGSKNA